MNSMGAFFRTTTFVEVLVALLLITGCNPSVSRSGRNHEKPVTERDDLEDLDDLQDEEDDEGRQSRGSQPKGPVFDPDFKPTQTDIDAWVEEHKAKVGTQAQHYGYVHVPLNLIGDKEKENLARIGIFKALNHVSKSPTVYTGEDVSDDRGWVYAVDTRKLWGERGQQNWNLIAQPLAEADPDSGIFGGIIGFFQNRANGVKTRGRIISVSNMQLENVDPKKAIDGARLAYNTTFPNVYNALIETPGTSGQLIRRERISTRPLALAAHKNAIVNGPRISSFYQTPDGRYYISTSDYFADFEGRDIPYLEGDPTPRFRGNTGIVDLPGGTSVVSESYIQGQNGCPRYFIWGAGTQERGRAELVFVVDPQNHSRTDRGYLTTGRSCISCHVSGVQSAPSDMPKYIEEGRIASEFLETAKSTWTSNESLSTIYDKIGADFREKCMAPIVENVSNGDEEFDEKVLSGIFKEPVLFLIRLIEPERSSNRRRN